MYGAAFRDTVMLFKKTLQQRSPIQLSPPPSLPPGALRQSRMEQSRVRWQWHPSHAMNNQWTPSGAYNRGAQLQSFTPGWLSLSIPHTVSHFFTIYLTCSLTLPFPLFPHILPLHSYSLVFSHRLAIFFYIPMTCSAPPPLPMLLSCLYDRLVKVSLILIQQYNSQAANEVTCCPLKDIHFYDL